MTEKYKPKQGDRVRVVLEGEVRSSSSSGGGFWVGDPGESNHLFHDASHVVSIEKLAPLEPEWKFGDIVRDATGVVHIRTLGGNWGGFSGEVRNHHYPTRPLTRLVPEGTND